MDARGPLCISPRTPVPSSTGFCHPHPKGISKVTCPGPNPDGPPPESSPPKTPSPQVKWGGPVHAPGGLRHFLAPLPLQDERCSRPPRAGPHLLPACPAPPYPPPPPAPLQAGPLVGPSLTFVRALLSPHKALFYPTNSCSSFRALREVPFSAKRPLTLDEPPGHPRQLVR